MNREEFLRQLRGALEGKVPEQMIRENEDYYRTYINSRVADGQSEVETLRELGDPRLLAKTIEDSNYFSKNSRSANDPSAGGGAKQRQEWYGNYSAGYGADRRGGVVDDGQNQSRRVTVLPGWLVAIIALVLVFALVSVVFSVFVSLLPVIAIVFVAVFVYKLLKSLFH